MTKSMIEKLHWLNASEQCPDADETVLITIPTHDDPVWLGYFDGTTWITVEGLPLPNHTVTAWAHMPGGPK